MVDRFIVELRTQHEWAWLLALYLFAGSLGGALYLLVWMLALPPALALVSIGLVVLGALILLLKLGNPLRAWRAISRPGTSWISRGVLSVSSFILFAGLAVAPEFVPSTWLPWTATSGFGKVLAGIAAVCALATAIYPGFVVASSRAIAFWHTPILPLVFFTYALMAASGVALIGADSVPAALPRIEMLMSGLIVINLVLLGVHLFVMNGAGGAARESVRRVMQAPLNAVYWLGVVLVGLIVPLLLTGWLHTGQTVAGACVLVGGLLFRYCVLRAGVYNAPAALVPAGIDFSKLNRTSSDFEREYRAVAVRPGTRG